jgi:hypothetical protein
VYSIWIGKTTDRGTFSVLFQSPASFRSYESTGIGTEVSVTVTSVPISEIRLKKVPRSVVFTTPRSVFFIQYVYLSAVLSFDHVVVLRTYSYQSHLLTTRVVEWRVFCISTRQHMNTLHIATPLKEQDDVESKSGHLSERKLIVVSRLSGNVLWDDPPIVNFLESSSSSPLPSGDGENDSPNSELHIGALEPNPSRTHHVKHPSS